ncbi:hypothetical protein [Massilia psychrophila]|uniref:Lipoprotein n=1 Tax=Massilia psychrophila TaxID=1603353 RepID=A0A2G8SYU2_9BURK|nr:hypothetical protein [Massilia psychrophila]PIL38638.1 hypothetical protein CR103_17175 [Massilia psychrophila]GGE69313.1 hypothetical protein GCM10008020_12190 [Massilia psychrophila]
MTARHHLPALFALCISLLLGGCATTNVSWQEVRDFADQSAKLGGYAELSTRFRDTYAREQLYLPPAAERIGKETDVKRRALYEDFISAQKAVVLYMQTLSLLAGDARYDLTDKLDDLGNGIKANLESGLEQKHVVAYIGMTRMLTRVIASGYQGRSVETMVRDGDRDLQTLLDAMLTLTRFYAKTNENEKKTILGIFDVEIPFATRPQDRMLVTLAKVHYLNKSAEYKILDKRYELAVQGLTKVSLGHQKLRENLGNLRGEEVRSILASYVRDLQIIRTGLSANPN